MRWKRSRGRVDLQLIDALDHLHAAGLYHGDIKQQYRIHRYGSSKVLESGLTRVTHSARTFDDEAHGPSAPPADGSVIAETPAYLAPEVWLDQRTGPASDLWALSVVLCESLVGRHPYGAERELNAIHKRAQAVLAFIQTKSNSALVDVVEEKLCDSGSGRPTSPSDFRRRLLDALTILDAREVDATP